MTSLIFIVVIALALVGFWLVKSGRLKLPRMPKLRSVDPEEEAKRLDALRDVEEERGEKF